MNWREELDCTILWLNGTGYDHAGITLTRVGPLFCVDDYGQVSYEAWAGRKTWHLTYNKARMEFLRRELLVQEENGIG